MSDEKSAGVSAVVVTLPHWNPAGENKGVLVLSSARLNQSRYVLRARIHHMVGHSDSISLSSAVT